MSARGGGGRIASEGLAPWWASGASAPGVAALLAVTLVAAPSEASAQALPDSVLVASPGLHPEGVEWDGSRDRFLVSSVSRGAITAVRDDGSLETLVEDPDVVSAIGIQVDAERDRLLVASSDLGAVQGTSQGHAKLGIYGLASGERLHMVDLGGLRPESRHFANDVTVGPDGTAYVTDSFTPVLYAVTPDGEASVLVEDPRLGTEGFGLNGIDVHPDGYLLVAVAGRRALMKVPLDAPSELAEVELSEPFSADGLVLRPDGSLVAVATTGQGEDRASEALLLRSTDGWASAEVVGRAPAPGATTAALRGDAIYVVNPHFGEMGGDSPVEAFEVFRVRPGR